MQFTQNPVLIMIRKECSVDIIGVDRSVIIRDFPVFLNETNCIHARCYDRCNGIAQIEIKNSRQSIEIWCYFLCTQPHLAYEVNVGFDLLHFSPELLPEPVIIHCSLPGKDMCSRIKPESIYV